MDLKVKYFDKNLPKLTYNGDWIDLRVAEGYAEDLTTNTPIPVIDVTTPAGRGAYIINAKSIVKIPLGIGITLPKNHEAFIRPRSSLSKHTGLIDVSSGVIDEGYKGDNDQWFSVFYATQSIVLAVNQRIMQFRIQEKQPPINFIEVESFNSIDRGGHGSSGLF